MRNKSTIIQELKNDHQELRECFELMKDEDAELGKKKKAFTKLVPLLTSHARREEQVIYSFMKARNADLKRMALEGEEEHLIADELVKELKSKKVGPAQWAAKAKVLAELLEHHIDEEEENAFPKLKKVLDNETDEELCSRYEDAPVQMPQSVRVKAQRKAELHA